MMHIRVVKTPLDSFLVLGSIESALYIHNYYIKSQRRLQVELPRLKLDFSLDSASSTFAPASSAACASTPVRV